MKYGFYPGCTLKTQAKNLEETTVAALAALGIPLTELSRWNCCGAMFGLAEDELLHQLAPVRNLVRARAQGFSKLVTVCSLCYHVLKRANRLMQREPEKRKAINSFMEGNGDYRGEVEVVHVLEVLRDDIGWDQVARRVRSPLAGLKVATYYGCTLLRPREIALDVPENPAIFEDLLRALGASPVYFPAASRCCGSFQVVSDGDFTNRCVREITDSARQAGAEALIMSCPLCRFNITRNQAAMVQAGLGRGELPVFYFTELLAGALGVAREKALFDLDSPAREPVLQQS
jgi:heterodisulfide reductase subunit B